MCVCMYVCVRVCFTEHSCALDLSRKASLQPSSILQAYYIGTLANGPNCLQPCVCASVCVISMYNDHSMYENVHTWIY